MAAALIEFNKRSKYLLVDTQEVVGVNAIWNEAIVRYSNDTISGTMPLVDFVKCVCEGTIKYITPSDDSQPEPTPTTERYGLGTPDWSLAPHWANYLGIDKRGTGYWYACRPRTIPNVGYERSFGMVGSAGTFPVDTTVYNTDDMLWQRPGTELESIRRSDDVFLVSIDEAQDLANMYVKIQEEVARPVEAPDVLQIAVETIAERGIMHDSTGKQKERSMAKVVSMFNTMTGHELTVAQGWKFMCLLKLARSEQGQFSIDSFVDLAAYAALAGEEEWANNEK